MDLNERIVVFTASIELGIPESVVSYKDLLNYFYQELEKLHINGVDDNIFLDDVKVDRWF